MKTLLGIVIMAGVVGGIYFLNSYLRDADGKSLLHVAAEPEIEIETAQATQRVIIRTVQAPGEVEALAEVDISSELVAKIVEMPVEEGDQVRKGDLLCRLDDADYRARILSAEANVARLKAFIRQADAELEKVQLDYDQEKRLYEMGSTSLEQLTRVRATFVGAGAVLEMRRQELVAAQAALQSAKEDLAKTVIQAPISGVVSQLFAKQGEVVITGTMNNPGTRIMVISDLTEMQIRCRVDETDAPLVAPGQAVRIYLQSDTRRGIPGEVQRVATKGTKALGRDVVTFETLVLVLGDDPRVKPGMSANLEIEVARREDALTIPVEAVVYRKRRDVPAELVEEFDRRQAERDPTARRLLAEYIKLIFCVRDGKAYPHLVRTGINDPTSVEILDGLGPDDLVVTGPYRSLDQLKDGSAVKLKEEPAAEKTEPAVAGETKDGEDSDAASASPKDEKAGEPADGNG